MLSFRFKQRFTEPLIPADVSNFNKEFLNKCSATCEDEQAVSTDIEGPLKSKKNEILPLDTLCEFPIAKLVGKYFSVWSKLKPYSNCDMAIKPPNFARIQLD